MGVHARSVALAERMGNWDADEARRYHERTKHSPESVRASAHYLDWGNRPRPFKEYEGIEPLQLSDEFTQPQRAALDAIADGAGPTPAPLALPDLARLVRWGAGVVRTRRLAGGETYHFRTYSSAGALYPIELYVACADLRGLPAGLYHFHPLELALRPLRAGDARGALSAATGEARLAEAAAVFVLSGMLWRSAWKYEARAYRHLYWDAGTMLANLLALAASAGLAPRLVTAFLDSEVNHVLGVDGEREAALALLALGRGERGGDSGPPDPLDLPVVPLSRRERSYPEASALHGASSLTTLEEIRRYRVAAGSRSDAAATASVAGEGEAQLDPSGTPTLSREPLETVIRRRGSARDFTHDPIPASELGALLSRAMAPIPGDLPALNEVYLIANALEGLEAGAHRFVSPGRFEPLRRGSFRAQAGYLCLEQALGARAAATLFFLADLEQALAGLGNRGYRAAQLEAGIRAGKLYLGAYAQGLGATGLTFYDDEVTAFLAPGTAKGPMLCVAIGIDARRPGLRREGS
jgi:SagB-type dehydrogenase family enzyme